MPRKGSPYGGDYELLGARILGRGKRCAYCSNLATERDHVPPVSMHDHARVGCRICHLVPSCGPCARRQGGLIRAGKYTVADLDVPVEETVDPVGFDVLDPVWNKPWLNDVRDVPASAVWPRFMTVPHPSAGGSFGKDFDLWCKRDFGVELRWWQRLVAYRLLEHDGTSENPGNLVWRTLILSLSRQLGKSTLLASILMWRMIHGFDMFGEEQLLLHVARTTDAAREVQRHGRVWAKARYKEFKVTEANGKEAIEQLSTRSRWLARAEDAAYGLSATTALADEAWDIQAATVDEGVAPTLVEHVQPQLLITSTAHRRATSLMLGRRALAIRGLDAPEDGDLFIEWSAPRGVDLIDRTAWRLASPHWSGQREKDIAKAVAKAVDPKADATEVVSVQTQWFNEWPLFVGAGGKGEPLVDDVLWRGLRDVDLEAVGPLMIGVEDCFGRGASAAAAGLSEDGRVVVGGWCFASRTEAYQWAASYVDRVPGSTLLVGVLMKDDVELADIPTVVEPRGTTETRSALSLLRELVAAGRVVHDGSDVEVQVAGAKVTPAPSGGLQLVNSDRFDLVRAASWVVAAAHREAALVPSVHGGS